MDHRRVTAAVYTTAKASTEVAPEKRIFLKKLQRNLSDQGAEDLQFQRRRPCAHSEKVRTMQLLSILQ